MTREPFIDVSTTGRALLNNAMLNKGSAFSNEERRIFKLEGLLPPKVNTLDEQIDRAYNQYKMYPTDLLKNSFCASLKVQNETLYYGVIRRYLKEMMRIIYTPTEGDAIQSYSELFRKPAGLFLNINNPDDIDKRLAQYGDSEDIDYIVVTDAEGILGIGDQGVGGIGISQSKLVLMTVCAGVHPNRGIPIVLDCGTNNKSLLENPLYMGNRHPRIRGPQYDSFLDKFVHAVKKRFPKAVLHFEDFGTSNAYRLLHRYQDKLAVFNDDIQGTGAVTLSALKGALHATGKHLQDSKIVIYGAGSAGMGIAHQLVENMVDSHLDRDVATSGIYLVDRFGLITDALPDDKVSNPQKEFAKPAKEFEHVDTTSLLDIVKTVKPDILIGCSTQPRAFTQEIVQEMAKHVERPCILPLSNPTRLHEAVPADLIKWTDGKVFVATGSPFEPVDGRRISENNNCLIFPGIGLGAVLSRASSITSGMIAAAVDQLASLSPVLRNPDAPMLPDISNITDISARVATSVVLRAQQDGVARVLEETSPWDMDAVEIPDTWDECYIWVLSQMWQPEYRRYRRLKRQA